MLNKNNNLEFKTQKEREVKFMKASVTLEFMKRLKTQSEKF